MNNSNQEWKRFYFKTNKVWVAVDSDGRPRISRGRALVKYQLDQAQEYRVLPENIHPIEGAAAAGPARAARRTKPAAKTNQKPATAAASADLPDKPPPDCVHIHTDGASSGNPGPAGIGVVLQYGSRRKEMSAYIGEATNNIAELEAIRRGLEAVKNRHLPVRIYTDSSYAVGLLTQGWKARKNQRLVDEIKDLISGFSNVRIIKVKGHAGLPENERADRLATSAIQKGGTE